MQPTVGRMVYYKARGSADGVFPKKDRAAVVTDVRVSGGEVEGPAPVLYQLRLCVMNPEGLFFTDWLDQGQEGGQWDWMPFQKDQQARLGYGEAKDEKEKDFADPKNHDWNDPEQFHGEDGDGNCGLCHGDDEQCAYCKAHEND